MDRLKWIFVIGIIGAGVYGNGHFAEESLLYRVVALVALALVALLVAASTATGKLAVNLLRDARTEIRKVIWPTPQEVTQTTVMVLILVLIVALMLWLMDWGLGSLAEKLIG